MGRRQPEGFDNDKRSMNRWKDELSDAPEFTKTPGTFVCPECFSDDALAELIRVKATSNVCSFTGRKSTKAIAAPLDVVVERIFRCLNKYYEDAANGVGWEEGEYVGATTWDTAELVQDTVEIAATLTDDLLYAIAEALPQQQWSHIDPYGALDRDVMSWSWRDFSDTVKHVRRYFFVEHLQPTDSRSETVSPLELLKVVSQRCIEYGLVREMTPGQRFFRCRGRKPRERFTDPRDVGPPPAAGASQSRMSPAGIPMFYGAVDPKTAAAETLDGPGPHAIAEFAVTRGIKLLDLRTSPSVSIFDLKRGHLNEWCQFMRGFIEDFRRPVDRNGKEQHYEYVPTQIVTEYFRSSLATRERLDGILYSSVRNTGGSCVVLFADRDDVDPVPYSSKSPAGTHLLKMRKVTHKRR